MAFGVPLAILAMGMFLVAAFFFGAATAAAENRNLVRLSASAFGVSVILSVLGACLRSGLVWWVPLTIGAAVIGFLIWALWLPKNSRV